MNKTPINPRTFFALLHDITVAIIAWFSAYLLRFNFAIPEDFTASMLESLSWVVSLQAVVFVAFGLYRGVWRFASVSDLKRIFLAIATATALITAAL